MSILSSLKKYFFTSRGWIIDLEDCTEMPSSVTIVNTIQNWADKNQKEVIFVCTEKPITFILEEVKYVVNIGRERGAYTLYVTNCQ